MHRSIEIVRRHQRPSVAVRATSGSDETFKRLLKSVGGRTVLNFAPSTLGQGNGLFTVGPVKKGEVVLSVPKEACIFLDGEGSINLPDGGEWPRGQEAMDHEEELLPWYIVIAACLLDAKQGAGCAFYRHYLEAFAQPPETLTQPFLLADKLRLQYQHKDIIDAARKQQDRLETLFPIWMAERDEGRGVVAGFEWAFATVRSRAFAWPGLNDESEYAVVPFLDLANHSRNANCDFRLTPPVPKTAEEIASTDAHSVVPTVELYALRDLPEGIECTISYTGKVNYPNQRMAAQYGFVPAPNGDDRITFALLSKVDEEGDPLEFGAEGRICAVRLQSLLGIEAWLGIMRGDLPYTEAAVGSLPLRDTGSDEEAPLREEEKQTLLELLEETRGMMASMAAGPYGSTLAQDEELLRKGEMADGRLEAAVRYRSERKKLLREVERVLVLYLDTYYKGALASS